MVYYAWENKRRDNLAIEHEENSEFLDMTDRENLEFRVSRTALVDQWTLLTWFCSTAHKGGYGSTGISFAQSGDNS